jgi:hypothetical protein
MSMELSKRTVIALIAVAVILAGLIVWKATSARTLQPKDVGLTDWKNYRPGGNPAGAGPIESPNTPVAPR